MQIIRAGYIETLAHTQCISEITAGLVGGPINLDAISHTVADVDLCDVLEDTADPLTPALEIIERIKKLKRDT
jgi:hypothetical protein